MSFDLPAHTLSDQDAVTLRDQLLAAYPLNPPAPPTPVPPDGPRQHGQVFAPSSFWNVPLPDNVLIDPVTPQAQQQLAAQATTDTINYLGWTNPIYVLPADYALTPVNYLGSKGDGVLGAYQIPQQQLCATGLPIPPAHADYVAAAKASGDSDLEFCAYQPDWVSPDGKFKGRLFECWRLTPCDPATGFAWQTFETGRMVGVATNAGHWVDRTWGAYGTDSTLWGDKDSCYERHIWGATASKLPLLGAIVTLEDLYQGVVRHAVGLSCQSAYLNNHRWPAQADDSRSSAGVLQEGMRLRLPPSYVPDAALHPLAQLIAVAARDYGLVIVDKAGAMSFRGEPGIEKWWTDTNTPRYRVLDGFPWAQMVVVAAGSDAAPNPL